MNTTGSFWLIHSLTLFSLVTVSPYSLFREPSHLFSSRRRFLVIALKTKKKKKVIMLGYDMFSLAPSFLQQFLTLLSLATISPYTLFREPQPSATISSDCVENKEEKKGNCDFWTYWFRQEPPHIGTRKAPQRRNCQCRLHPGNMHIQTNILFSFLCFCIAYEVAGVLVGF